MTSNAVEVRTPAELAQDIRGVQPYLERLLPGRADAFAMTLMAAARYDETILRCAPASVVGAALACAQLDLEPGPSEHVYLIPRRSKQTRDLELTVLLGYKGMKALAERHPDIAYVETGVVHKNDHFVHNQQPASIEHSPKWGERGDPYLWYAVAHRTDNLPPHIGVIDEEEVERRRKFSASPNKGPWVENRPRMCLKSAVRALWPELPSSLDLTRAAKIDDSAEPITPQDVGVPALDGNGGDQEPDGDEPEDGQVEVITVQGRLVDAESGEVLAEGEVPADPESGHPNPDDADGDIGPDSPASPATDKQLRALLTLQAQREDLDAHDLLQLIHARFDIDADELEAGLTALTVEQAGQLIAELQPQADDEEEPET